MDPEGTVLSKIHNRQIQIPYYFIYMWSLRNKNKTETDSDAEKEQVVSTEEKTVRKAK